MTHKGKEGKCAGVGGGWLLGGRRVSWCEGRNLASYMISLEKSMNFNVLDGLSPSPCKNFSYNLINVTSLINSSPPRYLNSGKKFF